MKTNSFIIDAIRTPIGSLGGKLSSIRADDLAALTISSLVARHDFDTSQIDEVILGCANQAGEDNRNIARMALLLAGIPFNIPGETINRLCASGMSAVIHAHRAIKSGDGDLFISGGVEHMTRAPWIISKASKSFGRDSQLEDSSFGWRFINSKMEDLYGIDSMGQTAEHLAERFNISRDDQDQFAYQSQKKAKIARDNDVFKKEIIPVEVIQNKKSSIFVDTDEFMKPETTIEVLNKLKPVFKKDGTVTAGTSSGLNDGSASMLIGSENAIEKFSFNPIARILSSAVVGVEPKFMGIGPVKASLKALLKANLSLDDMNIIEINEAFSAQVLACIRELGLKYDDDRINPNGGAIALGHPLGMTGTRIIQTAALQLKRTNLKYALITMCVGVGQGYAVIIERV
ncbi:MAG: acetyl-CoA C-acyltransferase [Euryarchaeota archaeon]|nr:acetyl-CoA C-acyltransferase [Euryarchaeota archaeon]